MSDAGFGNSSDGYFLNPTDQKVRYITERSYPNGVRFRSTENSYGDILFTCAACESVGIPWTFGMTRSFFHLHPDGGVNCFEHLKNHALLHNDLWKHLADRLVKALQILKQFPYHDDDKPPKPKSKRMIRLED